MKDKPGFSVMIVMIVKYRLLEMLQYKQQKTLSNPKIKWLNLDFFYFVGIWWTVSNFGEISGTIAIEMDKGAYIHALDNGLFTLGAPHREGL